MDTRRDLETALVLSTMSTSVGLSGYYMATWRELPETLQGLERRRAPVIASAAWVRAQVLLKELDPDEPSWLHDESSSESNESGRSAESRSSSVDDHSYSLSSCASHLPTQELPATSRRNRARPSACTRPKFECIDCGTSYSTMSSLRQHRNIHSDSRPYACPYCPKAFNHPSTRRTHIRKHTGEQPYHCETCPARFSDLSSYVKHKRRHSGEKPYACPFCERRFTQSCNKKRHAKSCNFR